MKMSFIALAAAALLTSPTAFAAGPAAAPKAVKPEAVKAQTVLREQTLVEELARGAREILAAAAPEISLPRLEMKLTSEKRGLR